IEWLRYWGRRFGTMLFMWLPTVLFAVVGSGLIGHLLGGGARGWVAFGGAVGALVGCRLVWTGTAKSEGSPAMGWVILLFYVPIIPIVSVFSPPSVHHGGYLAHKHKTGDVFYVEGAVDVTSALQDPTLGVVANIVPVEAGATSPVLTASCVEALEACIARWVALDAEVLAIQV